MLDIRLVRLSTFPRVGHFYGSASSVNLTRHSRVQSRSSRSLISTSKAMFGPHSHIGSLELSDCRLRSSMYCAAIVLGSTPSNKMR